MVLRRLDAGPRTRSQLFAALDARGVDAETAGAVLDRMRDVGLVDDEAFAQRWVSERRDRRGSSARLLRDELRRKGVAPDVAEAATAHIDDGDEADTALVLARERLRRVAGVAGEPSPAERRRVAAFLARRGHSAEVARSAVRRACEERDEGDWTDAHLA